MREKGKRGKKVTPREQGLNMLIGEHYHVRICYVMMNIILKRSFPNEGASSFCIYSDKFRRKNAYFSEAHAHNSPFYRETRHPADQHQRKIDAHYFSVKYHSETPRITTKRVLMETVQTPRTKDKLASYEYACLTLRLFSHTCICICTRTYVNAAEQHSR